MSIARGGIILPAFDGFFAIGCALTIHPTQEKAALAVLHRRRLGGAPLQERDG